MKNKNKMITVLEVLNLILLVITALLGKVIALEYMEPYEIMNLIEISLKTVEWVSVLSNMIFLIVILNIVLMIIRRMQKK